MDFDHNNGVSNVPNLRCNSSFVVIRKLGSQGLFFLSCNTVTIFLYIDTHVETADLDV